MIKVGFLTKWTIFNDRGMWIADVTLNKEGRIDLSVGINAMTPEDARDTAAALQKAASAAEDPRGLEERI